MGEDMLVYNVEKLTEIQVLRKDAQKFESSMLVNPRLEGGKANCQSPRALSLHVLQRTAVIAIRKRTGDLSAVWPMMCATLSKTQVTV
jgi:hypothetical protein